jgi:hypothetical protein
VTTQAGTGKGKATTAMVSVSVCPGGGGGCTKGKGGGRAQGNLLLETGLWVLGLGRAVSMFWSVHN